MKFVSLTGSSRASGENFSAPTMPTLRRVRNPRNITILFFFFSLQLLRTANALTNLGFRALLKRVSNFNNSKARDLLRMNAKNGSIKCLEFVNTCRAACTFKPIGIFVVKRRIFEKFINHEVMYRYLNNIIFSECI